MRPRSSSIEMFLDDDDCTMLLRIAYDTLKSYLCTEKLPDLNAYPLTEAVRSNHGAFVTLRRNGALRGCIGHTRNDAPLVMSVQRNTVNAATRDPRFPPMTAEELAGTTIEISALLAGDSEGSPFRRIHGPDDVCIGTDGVMMRRAGDQGGILLPQVATDRGWDAQKFLTAASNKAGYDANAWREPDIELFVFRAQVFGDSGA